MLRLIVLVVLAAGSEIEATAPKTLYWDGEHLASIKDAAGEHSDEIGRSLSAVRADADAALTRGPYSVMDKELVPPSGDKHDYLSYSRYWWPNPDTADGLPYVRRDGVVNRELLSHGDRNVIGAFYDDFESLALAAYLVDQDRYAPHALRQLRVWFIDPATRMNPNVKYGQGVPGRAVGRGVGLIDTRHFIRVLESFALLDCLGVVTDTDKANLKHWFREYLGWITTSDLGLEEKRAKNNHGSWYAAQASYVALFAGDDELAKEIIREVQLGKIPASIRPDGSQPNELTRTRSLHYSLFNLSALSVVARMGEHVGVDLWEADLGTRGGIRRALDYVSPYVRDPNRWEHPEFDDFRLSHRQKQLFLLAANRYQTERYQLAADEAPPRKDDRRYSALLFPGFTPPVGEQHQGNQGYMLKVLPTRPAAQIDPSVPSLEGYTVEKVAKLIPADRQGTARLAKTAGIRLLDEAFYSDRGRDLRQRQGTEETQAIWVSDGAITLDRLVDSIDDEFASRRNGVVLIRLPIVVGPGATLVIDGATTPVVRLSTERGAFLANAGVLLCLNTVVTSWDEETSHATSFKGKSSFRPFVASYVRSRTYIAGCRFEHLGFSAPTAYGFSLTSHPERERGGPIDDWPTGIIVDSEFRGLYYGFYSYEARDVAIVGNKYLESIVYGIDPHDRSTRLIIAGNTVSGTVEKHGIIGSRGVSQCIIMSNVSHHNTRSGFMLDRSCVDNLIFDNQAHSNGQGIAIYESSHNRLLSNLLANNGDSGIRIRNSTDIEVRGNTIVGHGAYALQVAAKRLSDHAKRMQRGDDYKQATSVSFHDNRFAGNRAIAKANRIDRLRASHVLRDASLPAVAGRLGIPSRDFSEVGASLFAGDLKQFTPQLEATMNEKSPMVEVWRRAAAPQID